MKVLICTPPKFPVNFITLIAPFENACVRIVSNTITLFIFLGNIILVTYILLHERRDATINITVYVTHLYDK